MLVSKRLGYGTVSMTLCIYGHLMPSWQREVTEVLQRLCSGAGDSEVGKMSAKQKGHLGWVPFLGTDLTAYVLSGAEGGI